MRFALKPSMATRLVAQLLLSVLPSAAAKSPISVFTVGDSITVDGCGKSSGVGTGGSCYPALLATVLGPDYAVTNAGVSGHTMLKNGLCGSGPGGSWRRPCLEMSSTPACTGNCSYWNTPWVSNISASSPDIITIMLGTNDAKWCNWNGPTNGAPAGAGTQFAADYLDMIKIFKALPSKPKIFVVLPPPAISQCTLTGRAGNSSICLAYNMSYVAINEIFPVLQRKIAKEGGVDVSPFSSQRTSSVSFSSPSVLSVFGLIFGCCRGSSTSGRR